MRKKILLTAILGAFAYGGVSPAEPQASLFQFDKKTYTASELEPKFQMQLFEAELQHYQLKERIIEEAVLELYFQSLAKKSQKSAEALRAEALSVPEPTEKELQSFYQNNRAKIPYPFEQIRSDLIRIVKNQKAEHVKAELLDKLRSTGQLQLLLDRPSMPRVTIASDAFFKRGKPNSKVQLVEFADYKCPHCAESARAIEKVYAKYAKQVEFVFIDFPVLPGASRRLAESAYCAGQQDKFWEYHKLLFERQRDSTESSIEAFAAELKLDISAFKACLASDAPGDFIIMSKKEGERLGVSATPTVFLNGRRLLGQLNFDNLAKEIDSELKSNN